MDNKTERIWEPHKSSLFNLDANMMALLSFLAAAVLGWLPGVRYVAWLAPLLIFLVEKNSPLVKRCAIQAFMVQLACQAISLALVIVVAFLTSFLGTAGLALSGALSVLIAVVGIIFLVFEIIAMVKAYQYKEYNIPIIGKMADWLISHFM